MSISSKKYESLKVDPPVFGQKFVLVSFVETQDAELTVSFEKRFSSEFVLDFVEMFNKIQDHLKENKKEELSSELKNYLSKDPMVIKQLFSDFRKNKYNDIYEKFNKEENPQDRPIIRGFKVRGSFSSAEEAGEHARKLQEHEKFANILMAPVGYWVPFNPVNTDQIDAKYNSNGEKDLEILNDLVKQESERIKKQKEEFEERVREIKEKAEEKKEKDREHDKELRKRMVSIPEETEVEELPTIEELPAEPVKEKKERKKGGGRKRKE